MKRFTRHSSLIFLLLLFALRIAAQRPELVVQSGSTGNLMSIAFSPDGRTLATGSWDIDAQPKVKLWEVATGLQLRTFEGSENHTSVVFTLDGQYLITAGTMGEWGVIKIWNVRSGKLMRSLAGTGPIALSPDGMTLASTGGDGESQIKLWDISTGTVIRTLGGHPFQISSLAFSPDGKTIASGGLVAKLWDANTGALLHTLMLKGDEGDVQSLSFRPDGSVLAVGDNKTARLWDVNSGAELSTIAKDHCCADSLAFSPDGSILVVGHSTEVTLHDAKSGAVVRTIKGVGPVSFAPDGQTLALGDTTAFESHNAATVKLWNVATGAAVRTLSGRPGTTTESVALSPDGRTIASAAQGGTTLRDLLNGNQRRLKGDTIGIDAMATPTSVAFSVDGKTLAVGDEIHFVTLWDVGTGRRIWRFTDATPGGSDEGCDDQGILSLVFSPDGKTLAVRTDNAIALWNVTTRRRLRSFNQDCDDYNEPVFSPDGKLIAYNSIDDTRVEIRSVVTGALVRSLNKRAVSTVFSSDGKFIVTSDGEQVWLWNANTGLLIQSLEHRGSNMGSIAISPSGKLIAGSDGEIVQLWDTETGKILVSMRKAVQARPMELIAFDRDERQLIGASWEDVWIWDIPSGRELVQMIPLTERDWLAVTPEGLFDGSPASWGQILWRFNNDSFDYAPVEAFFNEFYYPGLVGEVLSGLRPQPNSDITQKDRRQPRLNLALKTAGATARNVNVTIDVSEAPFGAQDLRLFRNGSVVKVWRGDVLNGQAKVSLNATIPMVAGENRITAYAFNRDNIKSADATVVTRGGDNLKRKGTAYVIAIGVDQYANPNYRLNYAVADANDFAAEMKRQQESLKRYAKTEIIPLANRQATKANILEKLEQLESRVQPEDAVIVFFAGHGTAAGNQFYLLPHDLGYDGPREKLSPEVLENILAHGISDREMEKLFEGIDAGEFLLIIDACNSGQALEAEEKRRGPMNSKGLAQLAYEKGMYVMTAAQSYQAAQEAAKFGHGFLTYALVEEGLKKGAADREPKNGSIDIREWLNFATDEVPKMQENNSREALRGRGRYVVFVGDGTATRDGIGKANKTADDKTHDNVQRPRVFYRRELDANPLVVGLAGNSPSPQR